MPLLLRSERLETDRLLRELTERRTAGVRSAEHVGSLAETAVDELDDGADQKIMRQVVVAVHLEVPAPRFIEREELVVGTRWNADEPPVILRRRVGGQQRPASRKSSAERSFVRIEVVASARGAIRGLVAHEVAAAKRRVVVVDRDHRSVVGGTEETVRTRIAARDRNVECAVRPQHVDGREAVAGPLLHEQASNGEIGRELVLERRADLLNV